MKELKSLVGFLIAVSVVFCFLGCGTLKGIKTSTEYFCEGQKFFGEYQDIQKLVAKKQIELDKFIEERIKNGALRKEVENLVKDFRALREKEMSKGDLKSLGFDLEKAVYHRIVYDFQVPSILEPEANFAPNLDLMGQDIMRDRQKYEIFILSYAEYRKKSARLYFSKKPTRTHGLEVEAIFLFRLGEDVLAGKLLKVHDLEKGDVKKEIAKGVLGIGAAIGALGIF